jgi:hypothetical protein
LPSLLEIRPGEDAEPNEQHLGPHREFIDYSKMHLAEIYRYFNHIENIISLELSISKFTFSTKDVIDLDNCMASGMPFYQTHTDVMGSVTNDLTSILNSGKVAPDIMMTQVGKTTKEHEK